MYLSTRPLCVSRTLVVLAATLLPFAGCPGPNPTVQDVPGQDWGVMHDGLGCLPNNDGVVERGELSFVAGLAATFVVNPPGTIATLNPGGKLVDGKPEWDFSGMSGVAVSMTVEPVAGTWFAEHFPGGDIAMGTTARADLLQVLDVQEDRVELMGIVSRAPDLTLMIYEPPIVAMRFPLHKGLSFSSSSKLKEGSRFNGLPFYSEDTYSISINRQGTLRLPHLRLHRALLIETLVTIRSVGGVVKTTRQLQWFAECYGEVVRALSQADEPEPLFTHAIELRRLAL